MGRALSKGFRDQRYRQLVGTLVEQRRRLKISQQTLADRLGTHQQFVSRFETGERRLDVVEFRDVAEALGLNTAELMEGIGAPANTSP
jgi:transcriptional regulator with XRE-family HTH domain